MVNPINLSPGHSWLLTLGFASVWLGLMLAYSPLADRVASRWFKKPPKLEAFRKIQQSRSKLIFGIIIAWLLGGIMEEFIFRGIVLNSVASLLSPTLDKPMAVIIAILVAALLASLFHFYQGPRAMVIIAQLSVLFGVLYVISGYDLIAVMLCHGFYDTIAFVRFARRRSKYSNLDVNEKTDIG